MAILGGFQNSDRSLSNIAFISKVDLSCVGGWPSQAHRSQTVSYTLIGNIFWSKPKEKTPFSSCKMKVQSFKMKEEYFIFMNKVFSAFPTQSLGRRSPSGQADALILRGVYSTDTD